jgi:hypothetical protein
VAAKASLFGTYARRLAHGGGLVKLLVAHRTALISEADRGGERTGGRSGLHRLQEPEMGQARLCGRHHHLLDDGGRHARLAIPPGWGWPPIAPAA